MEYESLEDLPQRFLLEAADGPVPWSWLLPLPLHSGAPSPSASPSKSALGPLPAVPGMLEAPQTPPEAITPEAMTRVLSGASAAVAGGGVELPSQATGAIPWSWTLPLDVESPRDTLRGASPPGGKVGPAAAGAPRPLLLDLRVAKGDVLHIMELVVEAELQAGGDHGLLAEVYVAAVDSYGHVPDPPPDSYRDLCVKCLRVLCQADPVEAREFHNRLRVTSVGRVEARLYEARASLEEGFGNRAKAMKMLQEGLRVGAHPASILRRSLARLEQSCQQSCGSSAAGGNGSTGGSPSSDVASPNPNQTGMPSPAASRGGVVRRELGSGSPWCTTHWAVRTPTTAASGTLSETSGLSLATASGGSVQARSPPSPPVRTPRGAQNGTTVAGMPTTIMTHRGPLRALESVAMPRGARLVAGRAGIPTAGSSPGGSQGQRGEEDVCVTRSASASSLQAQTVCNTGEVVRSASASWEPRSPSGISSDGDGSGRRKERKKGFAPSASTHCSQAQKVHCNSSSGSVASSGGSHTTGGSSSPTGSGHLPGSSINSPVIGSSLHCTGTEVSDSPGHGHFHGGRSSGSNMTPAGKPGGGSNIPEPPSLPRLPPQALRKGEEVAAAVPMAPVSTPQAPDVASMQQEVQRLQLEVLHLRQELQHRPDCGMRCPRCCREAVGGAVSLLLHEMSQAVDIALPVPASGAGVARETPADWYEQVAEEAWVLISSDPSLPSTSIAGRSAKAARGLPALAPLRARLQRGVAGAEAVSSLAAPPSLAALDGGTAATALGGGCPQRQALGELATWSLGTTECGELARCSLWDQPRKANLAAVATVATVTAHTRPGGKENTATAGSAGVMAQVVRARSKENILADRAALSLAQVLSA